MQYRPVRSLLPRLWAPLALLAFAAQAVPFAAASQAEPPIYVVANGANFTQGLAKITGYSGGGIPTLTYLFDFAPAASGQVAFTRGLAWDRSAERIVASGSDGFSQSFAEIDLMTGATIALFQDPLPVQMQGFAVGADGIGYGHHRVSSEVLRMDLELQQVTAVGDFGEPAGGALAISPGGQVYALGEDTVLRRFDPGTSQATEIGSTFLWGNGGMDFTADGRLFVLMFTGQLFELDPQTGMIDQVSYVDGLEYAPGHYYGLGGMCIGVPRPLDWNTLCQGNRRALLPVGAASVTDDDLDLASHGLPSSVFAMAIVSASSQAPDTAGPFAGALCLQPPVARLLNTLQPTTSDGRISMHVDLGAMPALGGMAAVAAGDSRYFQVWYRNPGTSLNSELTTAIEVTFQ